MWTPLRSLPKYRCIRPSRGSGFHKNVRPKWNGHMREQVLFHFYRSQERTFPRATATRVPTGRAGKGIPLSLVSAGCLEGFLEFCQSDRRKWFTFLYPLVGRNIFISSSLNFYSVHRANEFPRKSAGTGPGWRPSHKASPSALSCALRHHRRARLPRLGYGGPSVSLSLTAAGDVCPVLFTTRPQFPSLPILLRDSCLGLMNVSLYSFCCRSTVSYITRHRQ